MSSQFRYLLTPEQVITTLLRVHPEAEAMEIAVGGDFERIGVLEHALLREAGLGPESSVVDVGCGAGRLAVQLARHPGLSYLGTDVVASVLEHARQRAGRPDFRFIHVDRLVIPAPDASVDIVCFFSVLTHLLHEESFLYLEEAFRVLKPGGKVVFSFFEHATAVGEMVFAANLDWVRKRIVASQLNVFLHRSDIALWASRIGFYVSLLRDGQTGSVIVSDLEASRVVPSGPHAFGQSICVLQKPILGEPTDSLREPEPSLAEHRKRNRRLVTNASPQSRDTIDAARQAKREARQQVRQRGTAGPTAASLQPKAPGPIGENGSTQGTKKPSAKVLRRHRKEAADQSGSRGGRLGAKRDRRGADATPDAGQRSEAADATVGSSDSPRGAKSPQRDPQRPETRAKAARQKQRGRRWLTARD